MMPALRPSQLTVRAIGLSPRNSGDGYLRLRFERTTDGWTAGLLGVHADLGIMDDRGRCRCSLDGHDVSLSARSQRDAAEQLSRLVVALIKHRAGALLQRRELDQLERRLGALPATTAHERLAARRRLINAVSHVHVFYTPGVDEMPVDIARSQGKAA